VLQAIVDEMSPILTGQALDDVIQLETHRFLLRFAEAPFPRVHVGIHPRLTTMHLARGTRAPSAPTELAVGMTREVHGRRVTRIIRLAGDRVVRLELEAGRALVIELMGRAPNLLLVDGEGRVLRSARTAQTELRGSAAPDAPPGSPEWESVTFKAAIAGLAKDERLEDRLVREWHGFSSRLAAEIGHRARGGEDPWAVFAELSGRIAGGDWSPNLYSPGDPAGLAESTPLSAGNLFAYMLPLTSAEGLTATPMRTVNEAEEAATVCMVRHLAFQSQHQSLTGLLRREQRRITALKSVLSAELAQAASGGEEDRRRGELILAGMHAARKEGALVRVVDHYDPEARLVEIPIDPRLDLNENAQRYFKSARRRERTRELLPQRIEALERRHLAVASAQTRIAGVATGAELEDLERDLQAGRLVKAFRRTERAEVGRKPQYVQVREFRTSDGFTVLVGRTGGENDHLTFKVAGAHDLWLHAAGVPGAHVIVRNPRRLAALPDRAVLEAAALAAWFSKGKNEKELDVHVTWKRHVRKGKGMSPGMVMLKRHRTVRVAPAARVSTLVDD
jgi:predicted ribosome quality control (RQC) complex YloA/Tae2 family protein